MTLDELITALEAEDPERILPLGFSHPHSYRGTYSELAFEPTANASVGQMLADARGAKGATFEGWKGGDYTMSGYTDCWLAEYGHGNGETIGPILLALLLAAPALGDEARATLAAFETQWVTWRKGGSVD